jgi:hypothetical protein
MNGEPKIKEGNGGNGTAAPRAITPPPNVIVRYTQIAGDVHEGPGYIFWNILRPMFNQRPIIQPGSPPAVADPPAPTAWAAGAITLGQVVIDSNNNLQLATAAGTSAGPPTWSTIIGATTVDGTVNWLNIGPSWVWDSTKPVIYDQQVRSATGNIWQCIYPGTTSSTVPVDTAVPAGGIIQDGSVVWMNLGPTIALNSSQGVIDFNIAATLNPILADQNTAPVDWVTTEEKASIDGTLMELRMSLVQKILPHGTLASGSDSLFPAGAQNYEELMFGGQLRVPSPCVFLCSPRRQYGISTQLATQPFKYYGAALYKAGPSSDGKFSVTLKKETTYKMTCHGGSVTWRPTGDQVCQFWRQL